MVSVMLLIQLVSLLISLTVTDSCTTVPVLSTKRLIFFKTFNSSIPETQTYLQIPILRSQKLCAESCCNVLKDKCRMAMFRRNAAAQQPNCFLLLCDSSTKCRVEKTTIEENMILNFVSRFSNNRYRVKREVTNNSVSSTTVMSPTMKPETKQTNQQNTLKSSSTSMPMLTSTPSTTAATSSMHRTTTKGQSTFPTPVQFNSSKPLNSTTSVTKSVTFSVTTSATGSSGTTTQINTTKLTASSTPSNSADEILPTLPPPRTITNIQEAHFPENVSSQQTTSVKETPVTSQDLNVNVSTTSFKVTNVTKGNEANVTSNNTTIIHPETPTTTVTAAATTKEIKPTTQSTTATLSVTAVKSTTAAPSTTATTANTTQSTTTLSTISSTIIHPTESENNTTVNVTISHKSTPTTSISSNNQTVSHSSGQPVSASNTTVLSTTNGNVTEMSNGTFLFAATAVDKRLIVVLVGALSVGLIFFIAVVALVGRRLYESWQRRHYSRIDYLVNGMYN